MISRPAAAVLTDGAETLTMSHVHGLARVRPRRNSSSRSTRAPKVSGREDGRRAAPPVALGGPRAGRRGPAPSGLETPGRRPLPTRSANYAIPAAARKHRPKRPRASSSFGYVAGVVAVSAVIFGLLWWMLAAVGDEAPWLPAGIAAVLVAAVAVVTREVKVRREWARHTREMERRAEWHSSSGGAERVHKSSGVRGSAAALRALQQRLAEAEAAGAQQPEAHLEAFRLCVDYLGNTEEAIRSTKTAPDVRMALNVGRERVRELQRHHLLAWAREEAKRLTTEARRRVRVSDKMETAQRAVDVIDEALKVYPEEPELRASALAARDFVASVRIAHWVEMAERAAFRGRYTRAIARYRDALFYVSRMEMSDEARADAANRIQREIEMLRARRATEEERPVKKGAATVVRVVEPAEKESDPEAQGGDGRAV